MGRPIEINREHGIYVHQPKVKEIVDIGEERFNELIMPYILTTQALFTGAENEEELIKEFKLFDLFFIKVDGKSTILDKLFNDKQALDVLIDSLTYFLKTDQIKVLQNRHKIVIDDKYLIDENEFNKLRTIVKAVVNREDIEIERPPKNMTKRQRDIWMKLQAGRRRKAEREAIYIQDIINFVSFGGNYYIPYSEVEQMTYYQLLNAYKCIMGKDAFNIGMGYKLSQKFDVKDEIKHWTEALKIGK